MTEDEMVGWHHPLNGHEFEQTLGDGKGQGSLAFCRPWGHRESDTLGPWTQARGTVQSRPGDSGLPIVTRHQDSPP